MVLWEIWGRPRQSFSNDELKLKVWFLLRPQTHPLSPPSPVHCRRETNQGPQVCDDRAAPGTVSCPQPQTRPAVATATPPPRPHSWLGPAGRWSPLNQETEASIPSCDQEGDCTEDPGGAGGSRALLWPQTAEANTPRPPPVPPASIPGAVLSCLYVRRPDQSRKGGPAALPSAPLGGPSSL